MSTSSGRSRVCPKAAQRCEEILDAAIRCFREKGFHAASMSSIAKAFGMSAGHIYNYFDSKEDIIEAIVNRWLDNYIHTIRIRWNPDPDIHREEVQESIGQQIEDRLTCGDRALMFEIAAESFRNKKIAECIRRADRAGRKHLMEQAVACYREHGVEPPADLEKRLVVVGAFLDGLVFYTGMDPEFEPKTVLPILTQKFCNRATKAFVALAHQMPSSFRNSWSRFTDSVLQRLIPRGVITEVVFTQSNHSRT